ASVGVQAGPAVPPPIANQNYRLVKDWSFGVNITTLEQMRSEFSTRYIYANGTLDRLNDEWEVYRDNNNHEITPKGLDLVARVPGELATGKIESGMVRSKWSGKYGYIEGRMKVPPGRGMWPAFWLNPQDAKWPPEIDIMEIVNNGRDTTNNSFHILHAGDGKSYAPYYSQLNQWKSYRPGFDYAADYHTFAVLWEPQRVRHYVDNQLVVDQRFDWLHRDWTDGGTAHLLVNLAVGGAWPGPPQSKSDFPARMSIQYLRVWQKP
ncbi:MAG: hypothetical protein JWQ88_1409, partial [Rhodoferax sp.]|nr:hypothetical protein [Rhodoferax sp.]